MIKNAIAYVTRRRYRALIIFVILTVVLACIHVCLNIIVSSDSMERTLYKASNSSLSIVRKAEQSTFELNKFDELKIIKKCKNKNLSIGTQTILLESFAKSTARDAAKLYQLEKSNERRLSSKQIDDLLNEIVTEDFVKNAIEEFGKGVVE